MTGPAITGQELAVHLFAPMDGPHAALAFNELRRIWARCASELGITDPVPGIGDRFPDSLRDVPGGRLRTEVPIAARNGRESGAVLRRHGDVLNLSVGLGGERKGWPALRRRWHAAVGSPDDALLGVVTVFFGHTDAPVGDRVAALYGESAVYPHDDVAAGPHGITVHESEPRDDIRPWRELVVLAPAEHADELSAFAWSDGEPTIPPLARFLLHAAALRHQLRVYEVADAPAERPLALLTRAVEALRDNLHRAVDDEILRAGPLAEDVRLAEWFLERLADDRFQRTHETADAAVDQKELPVPNPREVFVIHGRDEPARKAVWGLLQAIDLRPLEWEEAVARTGSAAPFLGNVVAKAFEEIQAAVAILTPDDVANLHPALHGAREPEYETKPTGQARPNVLFELGMALGLHPDRTVIVEIGELRPFADLGGRNVIRIDGSEDSILRGIRKISERLRHAGCAVNESGSDWLDTRRFAGLDTYTRRA